MTSCAVYKVGDVGRGAAVTVWGWAGRWSAGGEQLHRASLAFVYSFIMAMIMIIIIMATLSMQYTV